MIATIYKKLLAYLEEKGVVDISAGSSRLIISTKDQIKFCDRIHCYSSDNTVIQDISSTDKTTYINSNVNISGLISSDSGNLIITGIDGKLFATAASVGPGELSDFSPNVIPFINSLGEWSEDANFNYINGNLGVGLLSPTTRLHVKGNSDTTGEVFRIENLSNTSFLSFSNAAGLVIQANPNNLNVQNLFEIRNGSSAESLYQILATGGQASYTVTSIFKKSSLITGGNTTMALTNSGGIAFFQIATNGAFRITQNSATHALELRGHSFTGNIDLFGGRVGVLIGGSTLNPSSGVGNYTALRMTNTINQTGGTGTFTGIDYNPTITAILGVHYGLLIRPSTLNGIGLGATLPTATLQIKSNSNSTGSVFRAENLSNTANYILENNGIHTLGFPTGGKVLIAGAVGAGEPLLEIRSTLSSSGGFIFKSNNSSSQSFETTNGSLGISTLDNSNINLSMGSGRLTVSASPSMSAINTGQRMMVGTLESSSLSRWLSIGYNSTLGQIIQSVQNGSSPTNDKLSLNPYGGNVGIGNISATAQLHAKGNSDTVGTIFKIDSNTLERFRVDSNGNIFSNGLHMFGTSGDIPQAKVDISSGNGYEQLITRTSYTPLSSGDANGNLGAFCWDNNYVYIKTGAGWKRATLSTF